MTPLEYSGLEAVTGRLMHSHWQAEILVMLLRAEGRTLSTDYIVENFHGRKKDKQISRRSVAVAICHLREGLKDIGIDGSITTVGKIGYAIFPMARDEILTRLIEECI